MAKNYGQTLAVGALSLVGVHVKVQLIYQIITGAKISPNDSELTSSFLQFGIYNLLLFCIAFALTKAAKRLITANLYDLTHNGLRTSNFWFYIFSARTLERKRKGEFDATDILYVDVLSKQDIVYSDFLIDFEYSRSKDQLEVLRLRNATKRTYLIPEDAPEGERFHSLKHAEPRLINGDSLVLLWTEIVNINISYIKITGLSKPEGETETEEATKK